MEVHHEGYDVDGLIKDGASSTTPRPFHKSGWLARVAVVVAAMILVFYAGWLYGVDSGAERYEKDMSSCGQIVLPGNGTVEFVQGVMVYRTNSVDHLYFVETCSWRGNDPGEGGTRQLGYAVAYMSVYAKHWRGGISKTLHARFDRLTSTSSQTGDGSLSGSGTWSSSGDFGFSTDFDHGQLREFTIVTRPASGKEVVYDLDYKRGARLSTALGSANKIVTTFEASHYHALVGSGQTCQGGGTETGILCTLNPPGDCSVTGSGETAICTTAVWAPWVWFNVAHFVTSANAYSD